MAKDFNESISKAMDEFDRLVAKEAEKYTEAGKERFLMDMASVKYNTFNKGLKEGIEQGIEQGVEQGEQNATRKHIINMLQNNMKIDLISQITGASKEKIIEIKEKMNKTV